MEGVVAYQLVDARLWQEAWQWIQNRIQSHMAGIQNAADRSQNPSVAWRQAECRDFCVYG
jgi:hypothetical protein